MTENVDMICMTIYSIFVKLFCLPKKFSVATVVSLSIEMHCLRLERYVDFVAEGSVVRN